MLGLGGQLGVNALGVFELAAIQSSTFVPHRGRARSRLSAASIRSTIRSARARSTVSAATVRSEVTDE